VQDHNVDIERAVIGEILVFNDLKDKVLLLRTDDFFSSDHQEILSAMVRVYKKINQFDYAVLVAEIDKRLKNEVKECIDSAISSVLFDEHFKILKELSSKRRLSEGFRLLDIEGDISTTSLQQLVDDENNRKLTTDVETVNARNIDNFIENLNKKKGSLMTGFGTIDSILGGIRKSTVFIVGARPSTGKTTFALNIAANQLKDANKKVMFFSLEMSSEMIYERVISAKHLISYESFSRNTLTDEETEIVKKEALELKKDGRFLVVDDVYNVEHICNLINENKPSLAVVDFMQIISATGRFENVRSKIDYISNLFKRTAKSTGCVILVLSQLSRGGKDAPSMSDLKESGGLEQDGDVIFLMHRPYVLNKGDRSIKPEQTELLIDKNKFGRTGKIDLHFDLKHQRFTEVEPDEVAL
jgi:replicative DNA helicase